MVVHKSFLLVNGNHPDKFEEFEKMLFVPGVDIVSLNGMGGCAEEKCLSVRNVDYLALIVHRVLRRTDEDVRFYPPFEELLREFRKKNPRALIVGLYDTDQNATAFAHADFDICLHVDQAPSSLGLYLAGCREMENKLINAKQWAEWNLENQVQALKNELGHTRLLAIQTLWQNYQDDKKEPDP